MKKVTFLSYDFRIGGAEKTIVNLLPQFLDNDFQVDLVLLQQEGEFLKNLDPRTNLICLDKPHASQAIFALANYFRKTSSGHFISSQTHLNVLSVIAKLLSGNRQTKLILTEQNTISINNQEQGGKEGLLVKMARLLYPHADDIVVVSEGAAKDLVRTLHINAEKVHVIYNPIDVRQIEQLKNQPSGDEWLDMKTRPVLIAVGRLESQKNFTFLLEAFNQISQKVKCHLVILGEGSQRHELEAQIHRLNLVKSVHMPGAKANPYAFVAKADIMLCTSIYEGFNIAVAESLACGTPVISLDCPFGPGEILQHGQYGMLVKPGDMDKFVSAVCRALKDPTLLPSQDILIERSQHFSAQTIYQNYLSLF